MNLRERAVADLKKMNIMDWGLKFKLIDPDGKRYDTDNETGEELKAVQILYDYRKIDPDTGGEVTVHEPVVIVALSSLARVPVAGERWFLQMPEVPSESAPLANFVLTEARAPEGGGSLGLIRLYPQKVEQS